MAVNDFWGGAMGAITTQPVVMDKLTGAASPLPANPNMMYTAVQPPEGTMWSYDSAGNRTAVPMLSGNIQAGGAPFVNTMPQMGAGVSTQTPGVSNQANFNFSPSGIDSSGSYNTADWLSVLGGLATGGLTGAASGAGVNDAVARLQALGQAGLTDYTNLAKTATEGISFTPYTLTSALGTTKQTAPGVISQELTPQQQANVTAAQQMQGSLYGAALPDTSGIAQGAFTGALSQS